MAEAKTSNLMFAGLAYNYNCQKGTKDKTVKELKKCVHKDLLHQKTAFVN
jgi:hypothetical protein